MAAALLEKILRVGTVAWDRSLWEESPDRGITGAGAGDGKPRTGQARVSVLEGRRWARHLNNFAPSSVCRYIERQRPCSLNS